MFYRGTEDAVPSYHDTRNFRKERSNSLMDCKNNQRNACTCRPQMQTPPCMNTNCGCGCGNPPIQPRPIQPAQPVPPVMPIQPRAQVMPDTMQNTSAPLPCASAPYNPAYYPPSKDERLSGMPIAMAYVPWQRWRQTYSLEQGLNRGTIFPELDLPFVMGRCR